MTNEPISVPAFELPISAFLSEETQLEPTENDQLKKIGVSKRQRRVSHWMLPVQWIFLPFANYASSLYKKPTDRYAVTVIPENLAGVYTYVVTPKEDVAPHNQPRVLINFHGAFINIWSQKL